MHLAAQPPVAVGPKGVVARRWLIAGVAVATAGMVAVTPGLSPVPATVQHDIQAGAVRLTAGWDPFAPWKEALDTSIANGTVLADNFLLAPGVGLQQAIVNQIGFAQQVLEDPSSFNAVAQQFAANVMKVATGTTLIGADKATQDAVLKHTTGGLHGFLITALPGFLPEGTDAEAVTAALLFLASPLSGVLVGFAGPVISPGVALINSAQAIGAAVEAGDTTAALAGLMGVPASMVNSFFNGADLDLSALTPLINDAGILPAGTTFDGLDIAFGGLLTPGSTGGYTYEIKDEEGNVIKTIPSPGGSILNSVGLDINFGGIPIAIESEAVGPIGAMQSLSQTVGVLLGSGWDNPKDYAPEWDGKGKPPPPPPPLFGLQPPALGDIFSDTAESPGLTKLRDLLKSAAVDNIAKKLQSLAAGAETVTDEATTPETTLPDGPAADSVAAANELTHATANKTVAVSLPSPDPSTEAEEVNTADEGGTSDETVRAPTESADAGAGTATPTAQRPKPANTRAGTSASKVDRNLVKDIKSAVKNVRNGLGGHNSRSSTESGSPSSGSSSSASSSAGTSSDSSAKSHDKE